MNEDAEVEIGDAVRVTVSGVVVGKNEITGDYVVEYEGVWMPVKQADVVVDGEYV